MTQLTIKRKKNYYTAEQSLVNYTTPMYSNNLSQPKSVPLPRNRNNTTKPIQSIHPSLRAFVLIWRMNILRKTFQTR